MMFSPTSWAPWSTDLWAIRQQLWMQIVTQTEKTGRRTRNEEYER